MNTVKNGILAVLVSSFLLAGCSETGVQESNEKVFSESTYSVSEAVSDSKEPKYRKEYDENGSLYLVNNETGDVITSFPEGWSAERISKMVTIDGYQLTLPCKVSDILALSDDFRAEEPDDYGNGTSYYKIWYKDVIAVSGICNNDTEIMEMIDIGSNEYTDFEKFNSTSPQDIFDNIFADIPKNELDFISAAYFENDVICHIVYTYVNDKNGVLSFLWEKAEISNDFEL